MWKQAVKIEAEIPKENLLANMEGLQVKKVEKHGSSGCLHRKAIRKQHRWTQEQIFCRQYTTRQLDEFVNWAFVRAELLLIGSQDTLIQGGQLAVKFGGHTDGQQCD